jgi:uncharacterized membrane protein
MRPLSRRRKGWSQLAFVVLERLPSALSEHIPTQGGSPMALLVLGLVIFLGLHSTRIVSESGREKAIARFGEGAWKGIYSLVSAVGFILIVYGFAQARRAAPELWTPPAGARHATMLLMLAALILLASYLFKRSHITAAVHHPMLWAVLAWSLGHLIANGSAADVLLFGAFFVWSVADLLSAYRRERRDVFIYPKPEWTATVGAVVVGLIVYAILLDGLHLWLFGVSPLAM